MSFKLKLVCSCGYSYEIEADSGFLFGLNTNQLEKDFKQGIVCPQCNKELIQKTKILQARMAKKMNRIKS